MAMRRGALDAPLMQLSSAGDVWTCRDAMAHQLLLGTTGAGKSSSTLKYCTKSLLKQGFSILYCAAKAEDAEAFKGWCAQTGRLGSLIDWTPGIAAYNFLAHELARSGNINNVIDLLMNVIEMVRSSSPSPGRAGDAFWTESTQVMLRHTIPVIFAATGTVRMDDVLGFIRSAPATVEQMKDPAWQRDAFFCRVFLMAADRLAKGPIAGFDDAAAQRAVDYWQKDFARLDAKTAGNIRISVTTALSRFEHGWLKDTFCANTNIVPELLFHGVVILMNFPVQTHGEDAAIAQKLMKFMVQRVCLARNGMDPSQRERPVAIIADECQNFLHHDAEFLAQCRSSRVAVVFATQSLPTLYAKIGGDHPHDRAQHLVSNFNTVVLHSSACPETNEWFARKIGRILHQRGTYSHNQGSNTSFGMNMGEGSNWGTNRGSGGNSGSSHGVSGSTYSSGSSWNAGSSQGGSDNWGRNRGGGSNHGESWGHSETMDYIIEPGQFGRMLKTGGPANGNRVSAIWYQAGRCFAASGGNALLVEFQQ